MSSPQQRVAANQERRRHRLIPAAATAIEMFAALLPRRYWHRFEQTWRLCPRPGLSSLAGLVVGIGIAIPAFVRHVGNGTTSATALTLMAAAHQIHHPVAHEVTSTLTQTLSLLSFATFIATPVGLLATYCLASGLLRSACAYLDDPMGDPALTLADGLVRHGLKAAARVRARVVQRLKFGAVVADRLTDGAAVDSRDVDVAVLASRPKAGWSVGTMVLMDKGCYRIVNVKECNVDSRLWVAYLLCRKTDAEIIRRMVRYET